MSNQSTTKQEPSSRIIASGIGSVFAFLFGWLPFVGPILGGGVAGYLRGSNRKESAIVGLMATVIASIPFLLIGAFVGFANVFQIVAGQHQNPGSAFLGFVIFIMLPLGYFYICGAIGGFIGAEFTDRNAP
jgi:cytochrome c biogenesis protein CcdA